MLSQEQNEHLCHTDAGTPMGDLFRRYWTPILISNELPHPDCDPVRVRVLGENLIAFRDTENRIGLIDEFCSHRGVGNWIMKAIALSYHRKATIPKRGPRLA